MNRMLRILVLLALSGSVATASEKHMDVLMIVIDDLRPMLECYGDHRAHTPNIDRLARRSIVFERAYCQYAKCGTSRLSLMTGLRPDSIRVFSNRDQDVEAFRRRRPDAVSLSKWLGQKGYWTQSFGKIDHDGWHVVTEWSVPPSPGRPGEILEVADPTDPGKETFIAERLDCPVMQSLDVSDEHFYAGRMTRQVLDSMRGRNPDQPLFLAVGYRRPHLPFVAPRRYFDLHKPDHSWLPGNSSPPDRSPLVAWFNSDGYVGSARRVGLEMPNPPTRQQAVLWNGYELRSYRGVPHHGTIDVALQLKLLQAYAACVSYVDAQIGRLLDELDASRRLENTLIILCSDHGWHLGEHSAWSKMTNFEVATRVPLLIAAPGIQPRRTRVIAELVDLYPTICQLTGLEAPGHLQGESLVGALHDPGSVADQIAFSQHARFGEKYMGRAMRTDRFRFVQWKDTASGKVIDRELYDHQSDALETVNVVDDSDYLLHAKRLEQMFQDAFPELLD